MESKIIAVVGRGYIDLPRMVDYGNSGLKIGFDNAQDDVDECRQGLDPPRGLTNGQVRAARCTRYTSDLANPAVVDMANREQRMPGVDEVRGISNPGRVVADITA